MAWIIKYDEKGKVVGTIDYFEMYLENVTSRTVIHTENELWITFTKKLANM